ncbi:MAG TPA: MlaD family protein [Burkholderiales bacterium]|nr:MlaD family protein [Burkholderiales bacterium]
MNGNLPYFRLGVFILLALAAVIILALVLGAGTLFRKQITAETYFNESVQGLEIGSKVMFRGVRVGSVTRVTFTYVKYELDRPPGQRRPYVLVQFQIRPELLGGVSDHEEIEQIISGEVQKGLRVRQAPLGITGLAYLEIDYLDPKTNPPLAIDWKPDHLYIPSTFSTVSRIFSNAEELVRHLASIDLQALATNVNTLVVTLTQKANELDLAGASKEATALLIDARQTVLRLQKILANPAWDAVPGNVATATEDAAAVGRDAAAAAARIRKIAESDEFKKILAQLDHTLSRVDRLVAGRENDVAVMLNNLRQITDNLRELSENAKRYPSGVIFGEPPKRDQSKR